MNISKGDDFKISLALEIDVAQIEIIAFLSRKKFDIRVFRKFHFFKNIDN